MKQQDGWVSVGLVTSPHGVRGEVRVKPLTDFPNRLGETESFHIHQDGERRSVRVEAAREHSRGLYVLKLVGVDDRDEAERLRGAELQVARSETVPLPDGTYYIFDLIGARVETPDGEALGTLVDVLTPGVHDVYVVRPLHGKELLIPAVKHVVRQVDPGEGRIVVAPPPGLLEVYGRPNSGD